MAQTSDQEQEEYTVIIDIGQGTTKVGFAGDIKPRAMFPTVTGKPKYQQMMGTSAQAIYVGDDTIRMRGVLKLDYPINRGNVMDWNQYYAILDHIFYNVLRIDPKQCNVIYIIPPLTPPDIAQYFARVLFETHQCKGVALLDSSTTSVFSIGETTGLSIEIGCGLTIVNPVMMGQIYPPSIKRLSLAGIDIEDQLNAILTQYGIFQKREIVKEIKEKTLKIAMDPEKESMDKANDFTFTLPDGEPLQVNAYSIIMSGEILFNPMIINVNLPSLPQAILSSLSSVDPYYLRGLLKNIIISGGILYIKGLKERLLAEIEKIVPQLRIPAKEEIEEIKKQETEGTETKTNEIRKPKMDNCPKCTQLIDFTQSVYCPFCGAPLETQKIEIIGDDSHKLSRKEKKLIKETAIENDEFADIANEVEDEYGSMDDLDEIEELIPVITPPPKKDEKLIHIITPSEGLFSAFKGAAIIGALPTFKKFFVTYEQFTANPNSVIVDFKDVVPSS